jgi:hypothetical protein
MKTISTSNIIDPSIRQPFSAKSLNFLMASQYEMVAGICISIIESKGLTYNPSTPYYMGSNILNVTTDNGINLVMPGGNDQGFIFFSYELFRASSSSFINTATPSFYTLIPTPDASAGDIVFSDNISRSVHFNRYLQRVLSEPGSLFPHADLVIVNTLVSTSVTTTADWIGTNQRVSLVNSRTGAFTGSLNRPTAATTTSVLFTLPTAYRPSIERIIIAHEVFGVAFNSITPIRIVIRTNGQVEALNLSPTFGATIYLDGLTYLR